MPRKITISLLAIDDEPQFLTLYKQALAEEDVQIFTTTSPFDGLELARKHQPDVVLLDLGLPQLGGMEMLEKILKLDPTTNVVIITGNYSTESAVAAIQKGAADY